MNPRRLAIFAGTVVIAFANVLVLSILRAANSDDDIDSGVGSHRWPDDGGSTPENVECQCNCHESASPDVQAECDCRTPEKEPT